MRAPSISRQDRRALALGVALCGSLIVGSRGLPLWRQWVAGNVAEATRLELEAAYAQTASLNSRTAEDSLMARTARLAAADSLLLDAETPAAAAANLAALLSDLADAAGVKLGPVRLRADTLRQSRSFVFVGAVASVTGDIEGIMDLIVGLEEGVPALSIRDLSISQPDPGATSDRPEMLRVDLSVEGLARSASGRTNP